MTVIALFALLGLTGTPSAADDWPQWRGPDRDGKWHETGIVRELPDEIPLKWSAPISGGYSAPAVAGGRVFVSDRVAEEGLERVLAFDQETGRALWTHSWSADYAGIAYPGGPRAAVQVKGGRTVVLGAVGQLVVLDAGTGEPIWERDLCKAYGVELPEWGFGAAPVFEGDLLIVPTGGGEGGTLIAFELDSGKVVWRALSDEGNYASPVIIDQAGKRVVVLWTATRVVGVDAKDGGVLWEYPFVPKNRAFGIATPVVAGDRLFVSGFYDGCRLLQLAGDEPAVEELWRRRGPNERTTDGLHCLISTPLVRGDHLYGVDSYGELRCLALADGSRLWEDRSAVPRSRWATIHMVENGDDVWMLNDRGDLILGRLSPAGFEELARGHLIDPTRGQLERRDGTVWSHPAFAGRCIFARNDEVLVCASLAAP